MTPGVVLAAGAARRFGSPKQVAELAGRPLLEHAVAAAREVLDPVVVVLGAHAPLVRASVDLRGARVVECPGWDEGMGASLRAGLAALPDAEAVVVLLGDQPAMTPAAVARVAAAPGTCRAGYAGVPGHPVRLAGAELRAARALRGEVGARELLRAAPLVPCDDLARPDDVDTPTELEALRP